MIISMIVSMDNNNGIGICNNLLEKIPEDMKHFSKITKNHIVVMGRKTYESIPNRPLSDRFNIVISNENNTKNDLKPCLRYLNKMYDEKNPFYCNLSDFKSMLLEQYDFESKINTKDDFEIFIIGGASIYKELLPYVNKIYITKIYNEFKYVDRYFPNLFHDFELFSPAYNKCNFTLEKTSEKMIAKSGHQYQFFELTINKE